MPGDGTAIVQPAVENTVALHLGAGITNTADPSGPRVAWMTPPSAECAPLGPEQGEGVKQFDWHPLEESIRRSPLIEAHDSRHGP
jgi:hypothetical protein